MHLLIDYTAVEVRSFLVVPTFPKRVPGRLKNCAPCPKGLIIAAATE